MEADIIIDQILEVYKTQLGGDFEKYRNHACRVYSLCTLLHGKKQDHEKFAIAAAFHDLGIWVNNTFDYLEPSISLAKEWLAQHEKDELSAEISLMIDMHHKVSQYTGEFAETVEVFRKADLIDLSFGTLTFGLSRKQFQKLIQRFPTKGFHRFLIRKTFQNFLKHPLRPLPMFRK
ncbi:MAG: hypothetical protein U0U09_19210 [Cyclobacteriaceae bacterium]